MAKESIERTNWLAHRWPIELRTTHYGQWKLHAAYVTGERIGQCASREEYDAWLAKLRPMCLARLIAGRPVVHPAVVLVVAGEYRLGRIPAELWCGYDTVELIDRDAITLLSAKARALFPAWPKAILRVVRHDAVAGLGLKPAPDADGPRLRVVG